MYTYNRLILTGNTEFNDNKLNEKYYNKYNKRD